MCFVCIINSVQSFIILHTTTKYTCNMVAALLRRKPNKRVFYSSCGFLFHCLVELLGLLECAIHTLTITGKSFCVYTMQRLTALLCAINFVIHFFFLSRSLSLTLTLTLLLHSVSFVTSSPIVRCCSFSPFIVTFWSTTSTIAISLITILATLWM